MKNSLRKTLPFFLLAPLALGCALAERFKEKLEQSAPPKVLTSSDGSCSITVPGLWEKVPSQIEGSILRASHNLDDVHLTVMREIRTDFADDATVDDYISMVQQTLPEQLDGLEMSPARPLRINGYDAVEFEASGTLPELKLKIKYLITAISTSNEFFKVVVWTTPSRFEKSRATMHSIVQSFKVTAPGLGDIEADRPPPDDTAPAGPPPPPASKHGKKR